MVRLWRAKLPPRWSIHRTYTEVKSGRGEDIFGGEGGAALAGRVLLLVWPNCSDHVDNPKLAVMGAFPHPIWDADCLTAYLKVMSISIVYLYIYNPCTHLCICIYVHTHALSRTQTASLPT